MDFTLDFWTGRGCSILISVWMIIHISSSSDQLLHDHSVQVSMQRSPMRTLAYPPVTLPFASAGSGRRRSPVVAALRLLIGDWLAQEVHFSCFTLLET